MDDKGEKKKEEEVNDDQVKGRQAEIYQIDMDHASKVLSMQDDEPAEVHEVVDVVTTAKLITEVVTAASELVTAASTTISAAEPQVPAATITVAPVRVAAASTRRRKGVVIRDPEEELTTIIPADTKSKDKGKEIMVEEPKSLKKKQQVEMDKELDYFKGMSYDDIRPIFEAKFNSNIAFLLKTKEQLEEEENRAIESINETPAQKAAKRRKLNATPLARKVPVVDYEIIHLNNKPHYKIIRADGTHQLYVSFLTLLKNFDREDLESLWSLVKERFSTSKPNNFSDDFLLTTLGAMFERPIGQAQVWKSQRTVHGQAKVKSWKLLESCGVHIITFTTTQLILLVERRYPLSRFTLDQILNVVRLRVEEQSEMSLELLRRNQTRWQIDMKRARRIVTRTWRRRLKKMRRRLDHIAMTSKECVTPSESVVNNEALETLAWPRLYKGKKERVNSIALKVKKESSDDETSTSNSKDKEYAMSVRDFKKFFKRNGRFVRQPCVEKKSFRKTDEKKGKGDWKCFRCGDLNHLIGECPKPPQKKTKRRLSGVLGVIAKMKMRKRQMKKLVSWLNRQMR
nr:alpha/beta hydrolases superfamily protein [Tanacetum cinerariifolium]